MNRMQEWLARAANELGVKVEICREVALADGRKLVSQALFPELGNSLGTLVFSSKDVIDADVRRNLTAQGYGISMFSEPLPNEVFDVVGYAEMFAEWGWAGEESMRPRWITR